MSLKNKTQTDSQIETSGHKNWRLNQFCNDPNIQRGKKEKIMNHKNMNRFIFTMVTAFLFLGINQTSVNAQINGRNVKTVKVGQNSKVAAILTQVGPKKWNHYYPDGKRIWTTYTETGRDQWSVYLTNSKYSSVIINLWKKTFVMKIGSRIDYSGKVLSSGNAGTKRPATTNQGASARLEQQCYNAVQGKVAYNRSGSKTWGASNVRKLCKGTTSPANTIACFKREIQSHNSWSRGVEACKSNPTVKKVGLANNTAATSGSLEQQCYNAVQGKVAYNRAGSKTWGASNVRKLCKGTTSPANTIACFKREIQSHNSWSRGVEACRRKLPVKTLAVANRSAPTKPTLAAPISATDTNRVMTWIAKKVSAKRVPYCYRRSQTRGAGKPLSNQCAPGLDKSGALCYPKCRSGYNGVGPVCWEKCAPGFKDIGAFCQKAKSYTRGAGYVVWQKKKCERENRQGCEKQGAIWYPKCRAGFSGRVTSCSQKCPAGQADTGTGCRKRSYGRTAGKPLACRPGMQQGRKTERSGLLCYPTCKNRDYVGVGPVCWQQCPSQHSVGCGFGCSVDKKTCASVVSDQVLSPIMAVVSLATLGSTAAANAAAKTAKAGLGGAAAVAKASSKASKLGQTAIKVKKLINSAKAWTTVAVGGTKNMQKLIKAGKMIKIGKKYFKATKIIKAELDLFKTEFSREFVKQTSPEINAEIVRRFGPKGAEYIRQEWAKNHLTLMFEADAWATAKNVISLASIADPTGIASVVNAYMHPICKTSAVFPRINLLHRQ